MRNHNPFNERIKYRYMTYLKQARGRNEATIDAIAKAIDRFEVDTGHRDFRKFRDVQASAFKHRLAEQRSQRSGATLSKATLNSTLGHLRTFFIWLADQPGYRSRIKYSDADYFNLPETDRRIATARRESKGPTIEQVRHVLGRMPTATEIDQRNRALVAFLLLTGARDRAIASMRLKHVDPVGGTVFHDAREVHTKNSKTDRTWFFPVGDDIRDIVVQWIEHLRSDLHWGDEDPLFPSTRIEVNPQQRFEPVGLSRMPWKTATPIRRIVREAFEAAELPYFNPHSFRNTLTRLGMELCLPTVEFKAWSQNLGHESVMTTLQSYGDISGARQAEILEDIGRRKKSDPGDHDDVEFINALAVFNRKFGHRQQKAGRGDSAKPAD